MELSVTYNFKIKVGEREYNFSATAATPAEAKKQLAEDLRACIEELVRNKQNE